VSGIAAMPKGPGDSDVSRPRFSGALDRVSCLNSNYTNTVLIAGFPSKLHNLCGIFPAGNVDRK
jgi:hypothetical protein